MTRHSYSVAAGIGAAFGEPGREWWSALSDNQQQADALHANAEAQRKAKDR